MSKLFTSLICCFILFSRARGAVIPGTTQAGDTTNVNVDKFLEHYGYLAGLGDKGSTIHSPEGIEEAIKQFQKFNGMEVTGQIDMNVIQKMKQPRCGVPDVPYDSPGKPLAFYAPGYKWDQKVISWKPTIYSSQLPESTQRYAFESAFKRWSDVTPLKFEYTYGTPDIEIKFGRGDHGDGSGNSFDGRGRVLAHAYYPKDGDTHFDDDEKWTFRSTNNDGTDLEIVAAHEFGHALGLGHSSNKDSLMAPYYKPPIAGWKLHSDDISGIQSLYGPPNRAATSIPTTAKPTPPGVNTSTRTTSTTTAPTKPQQPSTPRNTNPVICNTEFDAITLGLDGFAYAFRQGNVYKLNDSGLQSGYPRKTSDVFPRAPDSPDAAFHVATLNHVYIIKGKLVWRYTNFELDADYPKEVKNYPVDYRVNFAVTIKNHWGEEQIYLFGDTVFWEFNKYTEDLVRGYQLSISSYWRDIPTAANAGIQWTDTYIYIFKGLEYTKIDPRTRRGVKGYPKNTAAAWLGGSCGSSPK